MVGFAHAMRPVAVVKIALMSTVEKVSPESRADCVTEQTPSTFQGRKRTRGQGSGRFS